MTVPEKIKMARKLVELGVDILEAGFPIASEGDFEAVDAREHHIENHQIDSRLSGLFETLVAFVRALYCEAFALQKLAQQGAKFRIVIDE